MFKLRWLALLSVALLLPHPAPARETAKDIVTTAVDAGNFTTLAAALKAAGLTDTLKGKGPFTVFAPTDEAFAKLPKEAVKSLLKPENRATLTRILKYHVVAGRKDAAAVLASPTLTTLAGPTVAVTKTRDGARVNKSRLVKTDVMASNGVIHVIDTVLMPPDQEEKRDTAADARRLIENAVRQGARLYNHGDEPGCVRVYQQAVRQLLRLDDEALPATAREKLERAVAKARRAGHDTAAEAWALRVGLDDVYDMMSERPGRAR